ncbi:MAG: YybH family protein [Candidatus Cyclobacteriaceae bacterium M3_2C_046]
MHKSLYSIYIFIILLSSCHADFSEDVMAITAISKARAEAFNQRDAAGIAQYFAEDAVLMPPGQPSRIGKQAVADYYQDIFDQYVPLLQSEYLEVDVSGDLAYGRGVATVTLKSRQGDSVIQAESEYINILKKREDGIWITTHDIWNSSQED